MPELIVRKWDGPYSFMVFREYGVYKARRGDTAEVQFEDPSGKVVLQNVANSSSQNLKILFKCIVELDDTVTFNDKSGVTIEGIGKESGLKWTKTSKGYPLQFSNCQHVVLKNFKYDAGDYGKNIHFTNGCEDIYVDGLYCVNGYADPTGATVCPFLGFEYTDKIVVKNCKFIPGDPDVGIPLAIWEGCKDVQIEGNYFDLSKDSAITIGCRPGAEASPPQKIVIANNIIDRTGATYGFGVDLYSTVKDVTVIGNIVKGCDLISAHEGASGYFPQNVTIIGNKNYEPNGESIEVTVNGGFVLVADNHIEVTTSGSHMILLNGKTGTTPHFTVKGNIVKMDAQDSYDCIRVGAAGSPETVVVGNILYGGRYGIYAGTPTTIKSNRIFAPNNSGIYTAAACLIEGNHVEDSGGSNPIFAYGNSLVIGNTVKGGPDKGIYVAGTFTSIIGNRILDVTYDGISIGAGNTTVKGNVITGCGRDAIRNLGVSNCVVVGNRASDNTGYGYREVSGADYNIVVANNFSGNTGGGTSTVGANDVVEHNIT